jgi:hypothetical protein
MSEHIKQLFEGQDLSDEFKTKASAIFESVLEEKTAQIREDLEKELTESYESKTATRVKELEDLTERYIQTEVVPHFEKLMDAAITEWKEENAIALAKGAKVELAESFLAGMVGLLENHNMSLSAEKLDALDEMTNKVAELNAKIDEMKIQSIELAEQNRKLVKESLVKDATAQLSDVQKDKLAPVVEKLEFKNEEQFTGAIKSLIESYFPVNTNVETEVLPKPIKEEVAKPKTYATSLIEQALR